MKLIARRRCQINSSKKVQNLETQKRGTKAIQIWVRPSNGYHARNISSTRLSSRADNQSHVMINSFARHPLCAPNKHRAVPIRSRQPHLENSHTHISSPIVPVFSHKHVFGSQGLCTEVKSANKRELILNRYFEPLFPGVTEKWKSNNCTAPHSLQTLAANLQGSGAPELSTDQINHLAKISRLQFSDEEIVRFKKDLSQIVHFVEQIQQTDTEGVEPLYSVLEGQPLLEREDPEIRDEQVMQTVAPEKVFRTFYKVPRIKKDEQEE